MFKIKSPSATLSNTSQVHCRLEMMENMGSRRFFVWLIFLVFFGLASKCDIFEVPGSSPPLHRAGCTRQISSCTLCLDRSSSVRIQCYMCSLPTDALIKSCVTRWIHMRIQVSDSHQQLTGDLGKIRGVNITCAEIPMDN